LELDGGWLVCPDIVLSDTQRAVIQFNVLKVINSATLRFHGDAWGEGQSWALVSLICLFGERLKTKNKSNWEEQPQAPREHDKFPLSKVVQVSGE
jgi:hypothetical protein